jgi:hypothetical protein
LHQRAPTLARAMVEVGLPGSSSSVNAPLPA